MKIDKETNAILFIVSIIFMVFGYFIDDLYSAIFVFGTGVIINITCHINNY